MSDKSELSFVRCPSCRSLIPGVSTRCRMCGASLDLGQGEKKEQARKGSSRVRQNTMTKDESQELAKFNEKFSSNEKEQPKEDPLSEYIDEVEMDLGTEDEFVDDGNEQSKSGNLAFNEEQSLEEVANTNNSFDILDLDSEENDELEDLDDESDWMSGLDQIKDEEENLEAVQEPAVIEGDEKDDEFESLEADLDGENVEDVAPISEEQDLDPVPSEEESKELTTEEVKEEEIKEDIKEEITPSEDENIVIDHFQKKDSTKKSFFEGEKNSNNKKKIPSRQEQENAVEINQENEVIPEEEKKIEKEVPPFVKSEAKPKGAITVDDGTKKIEKGPKKATKGRLYGWLVSFTDKNGEGIELREGKFFITRNELKDGDLILDDSCISTPHAMVMVDPNKGFRVNDLMSERGVFVRHKGEVTYTREEEVFTLENGDWVRFGDLEFLVTLIPYVGEK